MKSIVTLPWDASEAELLEAALQVSREGDTPCLRELVRLAKARQHKVARIAAELGCSTAALAPYVQLWDPEADLTQDQVVIQISERITVLWGRPGHAVRTAQASGHILLVVPR